MKAECFSKRLYNYQTGKHYIPEGRFIIIFIQTYLAYLSNSSHKILRIYLHQITFKHAIQTAQSMYSLSLSLSVMKQPVKYFMEINFLYTLKAICRVLNIKTLDVYTKPFTRYKT